MGKQIKLREAALALSIALSLAQQVTGALAFSTEPVSPPQNNTQSAPLSPFGQQLSLPGKNPEASPGDILSMTGKPGGTEVTIPGIGSVGTLPKLDFGLELLYGSKSPDALQLDQHSLDQHTPEDGMQIKGTLSHKF
jgi:hypothetical protein